MNNIVNFLARGNKEVCELSSESDSDSDSFYLVGGQSDSDSDSFIVIGDVCDAKKVQDIKCVHSSLDKGSEVESEIKKEATQDQINTEKANIDKEHNSDENATVENVHDKTSMAEEEVGQTGLADNINNDEKEFAKEEVKFIEEESATTIAKCSEECAGKLSDINNDIETGEISLEDNNPEVSGLIKSIEIDIGHLKDECCRDANNINLTEERTDDEEKISEGEEYTDEEQDFVDDDISDEERELSDDEKEILVTATSKQDKDGSDQFYKDIVISETKTTNINQEEISSLVVLQTSNSVDKGINKLEDNYCNVTDGVNNKEEYTDEGVCTDAEEECIYGDQEFNDKKEEFTNNEDKEPATTTSNHSVEKFSESFVNNETKIKEHNLVESIPVIPKTNKNVDEQNQGTDDHLNESTDIDIKECTDEEEECTDEEEECTDEEEECTDEEDEGSDKEEECTDEEEECSDKEQEFIDEEDELSDNEEQELVTATAKHNKDGLHQFCNDIVNTNSKTTEINLEKSSPIVSEENNSIYKEIKQVEGNCWNATENIKQSENCSDQICGDIVNKKTKIEEISLVESNSVVPKANKCIDVENDHCDETSNFNIEAECTDEEEECTDDEEECTDEEEEYTDEEEEFK